MKKVILSLLCLVSLSVQAQKDLIIFRDGSEKIVQIVQVSKNKTTYIEGKAKKATQHVCDNRNVYMIKNDKRGNVFFTEDGERITGNIVKLPTNWQFKKAVLIYLNKGQEILAYDFAMEAHIVTYKESEKKNAIERSLPKSDIFMIKYADGSKDVLTDFVIEEPVQPANELNQTPSQEQNTVVQEQPVEQKQTFPAPAKITLKKDKKIVEAIVYEDNDTEIQYKRASNPDGPMYKKDKKDIKKVEYTR